MNKDELLKVAGEPAYWVSHNVLSGKNSVHDFPVQSMQPGVYEHTKLYTEAQLLALYAAGAADMKERAKATCRDRAKGLLSIIDLPVCQSAIIQRDRAKQFDEAAELISALPITPTNHRLDENAGYEESLNNECKSCRVFVLGGAEARSAGYCYYDFSEKTGKCSAKRPITPTNTEGEQG